MLFMFTVCFVFTVTLFIGVVVTGVVMFSVEIVVIVIDVIVVTTVLFVVVEGDREGAETIINGRWMVGGKVDVREGWAKGVVGRGRKDFIRLGAVVIV